MSKIRLIAAICLGASAALLPLIASAQSAPVTAPASSTVLEQELQNLLSQIAILQSSSGASSTMTVPASQMNSASADILCPSLPRNLSLGSSGTDVANLQGFLAQNPLIYPAGIVTAYFGTLTEDAVERWQSAYGIVSSGSPATTGYGAVGPHTRAAIEASCAESAPSASSAPSTTEALCPVASEPLTPCAGAWSPIINATTTCTIAWQCTVQVPVPLASTTYTVIPLTYVTSPDSTIAPTVTTVPAPLTCPSGYALSGSECIFPETSTPPKTITSVTPSTPIKTTIPTDSIVPITQEALSDGNIRYSIPVTIGGDSVEALLDTGSVGLRMLPNTVPASDYAPSTVSNSVAYGAGDILTGVVAQASLSIGGLSASVPVEAVQSVTCKTGGTACLSSAPLFLSGWPAIIGVALKGQSIPNPLTQIGSGEWIIELPLPGSSAPGELILNPAAADLAGYTLFQLPAQTAADVNAGTTPRWDDTQMPLCVSRSDTGASFCHGSLLDTGAENIQPDTVSPNPWPAGISATIAFADSAGAKVSAAFAVASGYGSKVFLDQSAVTTAGVTWNAGAIPFFSFSVLYDSRDGVIGLKTR